MTARAPGPGTLPSSDLPAVAAYAAFYGLDPDAAAAEWPFTGDGDQARWRAVAAAAADARVAAAEARIAAAREVIAGFLAAYGDSDILMFKVGIDLANSVRKVLGDDDAARGD